jgi:hypothetical protein
MSPLINESCPSFLSRSKALTDTAEIGDAEAATNTPSRTKVNANITAGSEPPQNHTQMVLFEVENRYFRTAQIGKFSFGVDRGTLRVRVRNYPIRQVSKWCRLP